VRKLVKKKSRSIQRNSTNAATQSPDTLAIENVLLSYLKTEKPSSRSERINEVIRIIVELSQFEIRGMPSSAIRLLRSHGPLTLEVQQRLPEALIDTLKNLISFLLYHKQSSESELRATLEKELEDRNVYAPRVWAQSFDQLNPNSETDQALVRWLLNREAQGPSSFAVAPIGPCSQFRYNQYWQERGLSPLSWMIMKYGVGGMWKKEINDALMNSKYNISISEPALRGIFMGSLSGPNLVRTFDLLSESPIFEAGLRSVLESQFFWNLKTSNQVMFLKLCIRYQATRYTGPQLAELIELRTGDSGLSASEQQSLQRYLER
jgi:hypothetical protein